MSDKKDYRDNIIIALSVVLVAIVIACCVLGCVVGIQGDIGSSSVAEAYYSPSNNYVGLEYYYLYPGDSYQFSYGDDWQYTFTMSEFQSLLTFDMFEDDYRAQSSIPLQWNVILRLNDYVQVHQDSWFEFSLGYYPFGSSTLRYMYLGAFEDNNWQLEFETWGSDCYFELEFRDSSIGDEWCAFDIDEIECVYLYDERSWLNGYNYGYDDGWDTGHRVGVEETYEPAYDEGVEYGYDLGYNAGYSNGIEDADNYNWYSLISAVFDAPLDILIGEWKLVDGEYVLTGGMLNFEMPGLDVNFAPVLTSLFTLVILIVILRFVFSFL